MKPMHCNYCNKETMFSRRFGIGTLVGVIITGGLWLIAMLFYPLRCKVCDRRADE